MVFSSHFFLFLFLPILLLGYYATPIKWRNYTLLLFSVLFYYLGESHYLWLCLASILLNYLAGLLLNKFEKSKIVLAFSIAINLSLLVWYKYAHFIGDVFHSSSNFFTGIVLPLGISFYTFHSISYLIDIYRGKALVQKNIFNMALYILNFPQLVAGPIIRYHDVDTQLVSRKHNWNKFTNGVKLFIYGFAKKMIIANTVGEFADVTFNHSYGNYNALIAWLGLACYTLQIYFDFSGYSDMAIGLGKMFGFDFKANFNLPYASKSIREFWQNWHISLSSWFKDYLYIPLGGNKKGTLRTALNLIIVFFLCGLWHGANYTFIIWGLYHGFFLVVERLFLKSNKSFWFHLYTMLVVMIGWVFFRSDSWQDALNYFKNLISFANTNSFDIIRFINPYFITCFIGGILISVGFLSTTIRYVLRKSFVTFKTFRSFELIALVILFIWSSLEVINNSFNPFIYYRF